MNNTNFDQAAWEAFQEAATEKYDFSTCQRSDGSYYGTGGTCRKGSPVSGGVPKDAKKSSGGSGGGGGMSLRDAQKQGMTTGGSKSPNWRKANNEAASRKTLKKTSNKDRAKD